MWKGKKKRIIVIFFTSNIADHTTILIIIIILQTAVQMWNLYSYSIQTLCFHIGMTEGFVWDYGEPDERWTDFPETKQILNEINHEFVKDASILYSHHVRFDPH